ncbi:MAG: DUF934 domain-containing protein [Pseudomonadota bacterium]
MSGENQGAWPRYRGDAPGNEPAVTLEAFLAQPEASAVRIEPGADVRDLIPHLDRLKLVEVGFPAFTDGRGYSAARILREAGYRGELRAEGDVLLDQLAFMRRSGFDSFAPAQAIDASAAEAAIGHWPEVYQKAADARAPIWAKRHG